MNGSRFDWPDTSSVLREKKESERFLGGKITGSRWKISFFRGRHGILFFISLSFVSFFSSTLMALRLGMRHSMTRPIRHSDTGDQGGGRRWTDQPQTIRTRQPRDVAIVCFAVVVNDERKKNRPPVKRRRRRVGGQHAPDEMQRNVFFFFPKSEKKNVCVCVRCFAWNEKKRKEKKADTDITVTANNFDGRFIQRNHQKTTKRNRLEEYNKTGPAKVTRTTSKPSSFFYDYFPFGK